MGTLILDQIKRQASSFFQERFRVFKLVLTDVTPAELLTEEATNSDPCSPDARTMTRIAEASFQIDDYWRITDVLHKRLEKIDWKQWRQSYKALVLLDFLLTHGPEDFSYEFRRDIDVIEELATFNYKDEKGFDWGANMQKKSERILELLEGGETLKQARLKAIKTTREIRGFGNLTVSPPSTSSSTSRVSSFGSYSTCSSPSGEIHKQCKEDLSLKTHLEAIGSISREGTAQNMEGSHLWDCPPFEEGGTLLDS